VGIEFINKKWSKDSAKT